MPQDFCGHKRGGAENFRIGKVCRIRRNECTHKVWQLNISLILKVLVLGTIHPLKINLKNDNKQEN